MFKDGDVQSSNPTWSMPLTLGDWTCWNQHPNVGNYVIGKTSIILSQHGNTSLKQLFENSGLSRNRWFHFADVLGTWEQLQVRWDQYLGATSRQCLSGSKTLGLTRNHKFKDNVYVGIYIYIHVLQSYNIHILYVCAYNNSPTWTKGSKIQDSLCRNLQGVRLAARAKVWFFQGETAKSGRQARHIEVCIYIYLQDSSQPLKKFLKPIYIKISSHSWACSSQWVPSPPFFRAFR